MKTFLLKLSLFLFSTGLFAQIQFQRGYFINNQGDKTECLIKNVDWNENPDHFLYKVSADSEVKEALITNVKEFQIVETNHYFIRHKLSNSLKKSDSKIDAKENDLIFLRVLVDGEARLYEYKKKHKYFLYSIGDNDPAYLNYSESVDENNKIIKSYTFRKTLYDNLKCKTFSLENFSNLKYDYEDLVTLFNAYNNCLNSDYTNYFDYRTKSKFVFKILAKLNLVPQANATYSFDAGGSTPSGGASQGVRNDIDFTNEINPSLGVEIEYLLPFLRNKLSVFFAPNIQQYSSEYQTNDLYGRPVNNLLAKTEVEYLYAELSIGIRYYMFLNDSYKLFAQAAVSQNVILNSKENRTIVYEGNEVDFSYHEMDKKNTNLYLGFGCQYKNKLSLAINYYPAKNVTGDIFKLDMKGALAIGASYKVF